MSGFDARSAMGQQAPAALPPGQRVYAIGDVHGQAARLARMLDQIADDLAARPVANQAADPVVVLLGDLIDRGPDSAAVLDLLLHTALPVVTLRGNHEAMALDVLEGRGGQDLTRTWLAHGGIETLHGWGLSEQADPAGWIDAVPRLHLALLRGLLPWHRVGEYLFVHAGIRPGIPLAQQNPHDLLWMREPFLSWPTGWGPAGWGPDEPRVVVHGHTPKNTVVIGPNRIGVDTGAGFGGVLSCVVLEQDRLHILTA